MSEKETPNWISSLVGYPRRDTDGVVVGIEWSIVTLTDHVDRLPDNMKQVADEMLARAPQRFVSSQQMESTHDRP